MQKSQMLRRWEVGRKPEETALIFENLTIGDFAKVAQ